MTAARYVTIWCDGKVHPGEDLERDCGNHVEGDTAEDIRREPKKGWLHGLPGGRDLCPEHAGQRGGTWRWGVPTTVTSVEPGCTCGGVAACLQCQERDAAHGTTEPQPEERAT